MFIGFLGRGILPIYIDQFGPNAVLWNIENGELQVDLVFTHYDFIHSINLPRGLGDLIIDFYLPLFTGRGSDATGLEITDVPEVFVDTHDITKFFVKPTDKSKGKLYLAAFKNERMTMSRIATFLLLLFLIVSCENDDTAAPVPEPPRPLSEVAMEDEAKIQEYLKTHYYNYQDFDSVPANFDFKIRVQEISEGDTSRISLANQVESKIIRLSSSDLGLDGAEENIEHKLYYLRARAGVGEKPTEVDSLFLRYEGMLLNGSVFESNINNPVWFDLQGTLSQNNRGVIQGFKRGLPQFESGGEIISNDDGTFNVEGFSSGLLIFPSALGYYNGTNVGPAYSPIIFNVQPLVAITADHDRDGVPTKDEVEIDEEGKVTLTDTNNDGIPDYLDPETK